MDIVDAHYHLWDRGRFRYSWLRGVPAIDRVMFGSDWPVATLVVGYRDWLDVVERLIEGASRAVRLSLLRDTATRFYRL